MLQVYSFSAKKEEDNKLIEQLKIKASKTGVSFSRLVLDALNSQYKEAKKNEDK